MVDRSTEQRYPTAACRYVGLDLIACEYMHPGIPTTGSTGAQVSPATQAAQERGTSWACAFWKTVLDVRVRINLAAKHAAVVPAHPTPIPLVRGSLCLAHPGRTSNC